MRSFARRYPRLANEVETPVVIRQPDCDLYPVIWPAVVFAQAFGFVPPEDEWVEITMPRDLLEKQGGRAAQS